MDLHLGAEESIERIVFTLVLSSTQIKITSLLSFCLNAKAVNFAYTNIHIKD